MKDTSLELLPPTQLVETKAILKQVARSHRYLAELKGILNTIPNQSILINTLAIQEAKESSAIENIITTHDEIFKLELATHNTSSSAAKEVQNYAKALQSGFLDIKNDGFFSTRHILAIQAMIENNKAGFRKLPGTTLKNASTGETIYTPPQHHDAILHLMRNLEQYINDETLSDCDDLVKMAVIHHQFESIHPFYDGNGRTGRIINMLYLVLKKLLDIPVLYLSKYIIRTKSDYYRLLQSVRDDQNWEPWVLYILKGIEMTAQETIVLIKNISELMQQYKNDIRKNFQFYSQDLLNNLFRHPYTKIEFLQKDLHISRITAMKYLDALSKAGFLEKQKIWRNNYYINKPLFALLTK